MYRLGIFCSQLVHFGHLSRYISGFLGKKWNVVQIFFLNQYILALFFVSGGRLWAFWALMYVLGIFYS